MSGSPGGAELCGYIRGNCKTILGSRFWDVRRVLRVDVGSKPEKLESKFLVISKFRFFFLSGKVSSKLQVENNYHLLQISAIEVADSHVRVLVDGKMLYLHPLDDSATASSLAHDLMCAFKHYFPECNVRKFMDLVPNSLYSDYVDLTDRAPSLPCGGFRRTYAALCDFYKLAYWEEVVWDVEKIYASHDSRTLRLEDFDHLNAKDLVSILAVLEYSNWFTGLSVQNMVPSIKFIGELLDILIRVLRKNQSLELLELVNCGLKADFLTSFGTILTQNSSIPLKHLNFSKNNFEDNYKAISHLSASLLKHECSLVAIDLSDCGFGSKSINSLARGIQGHAKTKTIDNLTVLKLAGNSLKEEMNDLQQLISRCTALVELDLSRTGFMLEKLWSALVFGGLELVTLKSSGCVFSYRKAKDVVIPNFLKSFFTSALSLKHLDLSNCALPPEVLKQILLGLACNQQLTGVELNLSGTCVDKQTISVLENCLEKMNCVEALILRDNGFGDDLPVILGALAKMPRLRKLDISGNNFVGVRPRSLPGVLMEVVKILNDDEKAFEELVLADCRLGSNLSVVINALGVCPHLQRLDISGNAIRDAGARLLAKAIQVNGSIRALTIDRNQISFHGFGDLAHALQQNYAIIELPYPLADATESLGKDKERTEIMLNQIQETLLRNRVAGRRCSDQLNRSLHAQSKIVIGTAEDELNKHVCVANRLLADYELNPESEDVRTLKALLDDAEKTKALIPKLLDECESPDFIDASIRDQLKAVQDGVRGAIEQNLHAMLKCPENSMTLPALSSLKFRADARFDVCTQKAQFDASIPISDFSASLKQAYRTINLNVATTITEKIVQEIIDQLVVLVKRLAAEAKATSLSANSSGGSDHLKSPSTPKQKKKLKVFSQFSRPKSIVATDGMIESVESSERGASLSFDSPDNISMDSADALADELPTLKPSDANKLIHLQKSRPKRPKNVRSNQTLASTPTAPSSASLLSLGTGPNKHCTSALLSEAEIAAVMNGDVSQDPLSVETETAEALEDASNGNLEASHQSSAAGIRPGTALKPPPRKKISPKENSDTASSIALQRQDGALKTPLQSPKLSDDSKVPPNTPSSPGPRSHTSDSFTLCTLNLSATALRSQSPPEIVDVSGAVDLECADEKHESSPEKLLSDSFEADCVVVEMPPTTELIEEQDAVTASEPAKVSSDETTSHAAKVEMLASVFAKGERSSNGATSAGEAAPSSLPTSSILTTGVKEEVVEPRRSLSSVGGRGSALPQRLSMVAKSKEELDRPNVATNVIGGAPKRPEGPTGIYPKLDAANVDKNANSDVDVSASATPPGRPALPLRPHLPSGGNKVFAADQNSNMNTSSTTSVANRKSFYAGEAPPRPAPPSKSSVLLRHVPKNFAAAGQDDPPSSNEDSPSAAIITGDHRPKSVVAEMKAQFEVGGVAPRPPVRPRRRNVDEPPELVEEVEDEDSFESPGGPLPDVTPDDLKDRISKLLGVQYLAPVASSSDRRLTARLFGCDRVMVPMAVSFGPKCLQCIFLVDTGASATCLCTAFWQELGLGTQSLLRMAYVEGHTRSATMVMLNNIPTSVVLSKGLVVDINMLGSRFLREHRAVVSYESDDDIILRLRSVGGHHESTR